MTVNLGKKEDLRTLSYTKTPTYQTPATERECEIGALTIVNTLQYSPLCLLINMKEASKYLRELLSSQRHGSILDLQPVWNYLVAQPHVAAQPQMQKDALKAFFQELERQHLPWQLKLPKEVKPSRPMSTKTTLEIRTVRASDLLRRASGEKLRPQTPHTVQTISSLLKDKAPRDPRY